jgi:hypothetical protein
MFNQDTPEEMVGQIEENRQMEDATAFQELLNRYIAMKQQEETALEEQSLDALNSSFE